MLQDKVIVVTGGGSGIGAAAARQFAIEGARVAVADLNPEQGAAVAGELRDAGYNARFIAVDVAREAQVESMVGKVLAEYGRLDGAFNNAGIGPTPALIGEASEAEWQRVLGVNLTGVFLCVKHEIRAMQKTGGGAIVNMSSVGGLRGVPMQAAYSASKHGVIGVTRTAAAEYARAGIRVNAVCPGVVDTPATRGMGIDWNTVVPVPLGRIARPVEIAELALWLLSDRAAYVTGQAYAIDGGMTATTFTPN
jgi:NAD(P)-dependent dehydrogenase (short-subunit alcohol dehydrogenase family)